MWRFGDDTDVITFIETKVWNNTVKCEEQEKWNNSVKSFAEIEFVWVFRVGVFALIDSISHLSVTFL